MKAQTSHPWRLRALGAALLVMLSLGSGAPAAAQDVAVSGQVGTLGPEIELGGKFNDYLGARLQGSGLLWGYDVSVDNIDYDFDMKLLALGGLLDLHPFAGGFRFTGGVLFNINKLDSDVDFSSNKFYQIGDQMYPGLLLRGLEADAEFNPVAPYLGLGYGGDFTGKGHWYFSCDLGVMYWGKPDVTLKAKNDVPVPGLDENLKREENSLESELENLQFYPVVAVGLTYRF
ncbi:MAG: hypothetical protein KQJ78_18965 [Deltaproteobacteria bacterium]|nr:hypothetical protein [Deltaproteobacteria bacterium]